jgi:quinol-cytochrome oxidoreductase complex cytochrome b subunit
MAAPNGIAILVGIGLSIVVEYVVKFKDLAPRYKRAVFFVLCVLIPVFAAALGVWTDGWPASWSETFWPAVMAGILTFAAGTMAHLPKLPDVPGAS